MGTSAVQHGPWTHGRALILSPMLLEVTARFHLMHIYSHRRYWSCFSVWALAVGWRRNLHVIAWIGTLAGLMTASALFRETHDAAAWSGHDSAHCALLSSLPPAAITGRAAMGGGLRRGITILVAHLFVARPGTLHHACFDFPGRTRRDLSRAAP